MRWPQLHVLRIVCAITLRAVYWRKRTWGMLLLAALPVGLVLTQRLVGHLGTQQLLRFFPEMTVYLYLMFIGMLLALFYGSAVVADEIENRTLTYLFTRPVAKSTILIGKYLAYLCGTLPLVGVSFLLTFVLHYTQPRMAGYWGEGVQVLPRYLAIVMMALVCYGAIYLLFGTQFRRPVLYGLLIFGWEKIVLMLSGKLRRLSVIYYLLSALPEANLSRDLKGLRAGSVSAEIAWLTLAGITLVFLLGAIGVFSSREYRLTE